MELRYCGTESVAVSLLPDRELIVHTGEVVEATDAEAKKLEAIGFERLEPTPSTPKSTKASKDDA